MRQQGTNTVADALRTPPVFRRSVGTAHTSNTRFEDSSIRTTSMTSNVVLVDGMRLGGNRYGTQTKQHRKHRGPEGPIRILYGRGAVGGAIISFGKKPQGTGRFDISYRIGRYGTHQLSGGLTGPSAQHEASLSSRRQL